jgi:hypothetical protein
MNQPHQIRRLVKPAFIGAALTVLLPFLLVATATPSAAATPSAKHQDQSFGGYYMNVQGELPTVMNAQVTITVPTLTCSSSNPNALRMLYIQQALELGGGNYASGMVIAQCYDGAASYSIAGGVCDGSGCGSCTSGSCGSGCSGDSSLAVSAGDTVTIQASADSGQDSSTQVTVNGGDAGFQCTGIGLIPDSEAVYMGMCGQDVPDFGKRDVASVPPAPDGSSCQPGRRPKFSTIDFTDATINNAPLNTSSYNPTKYDLVDGTTVQENTGKLSAGGESFNETFAHH